METETVLCDGGPLHGKREIAEGLNGIPVTTANEQGQYLPVGRTEAGFRLFEWREGG